VFIRILYWSIGNIFNTLIFGGITMNQMDNMKRVQMSLKKKEEEAAQAKEKGMHTTYGNLLLEINLLKTEMKKMQMGSK